jgi:hypothetical protein
VQCLWTDVGKQGAISCLTYWSIIFLPSDRYYAQFLSELPEKPPPMLFHVLVDTVMFPWSCICIVLWQIEIKMS